MGETPLRRNFDFRRLWAATAMSEVGTRTMGLVYPLIGIAATGSPAIAGLIGFVWVVPGVLSYLPAGIVVDRNDPRSVVIWCEIGRAITLVLVVAGFMVGGLPPLPMLLAAAASEGALASVQTLAATALLRTIVPGEQQLTGAVSRVETTNHLAVLGGRILGGGILAVANAAPFVANLALRVLSLILIFRVRAKTAPGPASRPRITAGLRELARTPLWRTVSLLAYTNVIAQALIILFLTRASEAGTSPVVIGLVLAASGIGGVMGALAAPAVRRWLAGRTSVMLVYAWTWVMALSIAALGDSAPTYAVAMLLSGLIGAVGNVAVRSYTIRSVPQENLAQVLSVMALVSFGAVSLGPPVGGLLATVLGAQGGVWTLFLVMAPAAVFVSAARARKIGLRISPARPPDPGTPQPGDRAARQIASNCPTQ